MKKILSMLFAVAAIAMFALTSCEKEIDSKSDLGKELIGIWQGQAHPILANPYDLTLSFTAETVTFTNDQGPETYNYTVGSGVANQSYFKIDNTLGSAFYYTVTADTLEITAGNSTFYINGKYVKVK
ncbi:MAG: hypothetical protein MJY96_09390 [Bacteroidaceae bacterium]|nr:hypothetical protein [Candidatus Colenecus caballi]MCQ2073318.1 hypothetical protein [Bacteroidaceae bacterium]